MTFSSLARTDPADDALASLRGLRARYQGAMLGLAPLRLGKPGAES